MISSCGRSAKCFSFSCSQLRFGNFLPTAARLANEHAVRLTSQVGVAVVELISIAALAVAVLRLNCVDRYGLADGEAQIARLLNTVLVNCITKCTN